MAENYDCCDGWVELCSWIDHVEVSHHFTEILRCPSCNCDLPVSEIRQHVINEHLIACPHEGCTFLSDSFDAVQSHFVRTHFGSSESQPQDGETSQRISNLFQTLIGVRNVCLAKHLILHKIGAEDRGYGCGFRNLQTVVASLLFESDIRQVCGFTTVPTISQIQIDIERAWRAGFDPLGAVQLGRHLHGTRKWIGATDIATFLQYHHIRVQVVDVKLYTNITEMQRRLVDWVKIYFQSVDTPFPLFFQHAGHSRTIIGVEEREDGCNLLIYDPNVSPERIEEAIRSSSTQILSFLRFPYSSLTEREYQLVAVRGILPAECYDIAKDFTMFNHIIL